MSFDVTAIAAGASAIVGVIIAQKTQSRRNGKMAEKIEPMLREQGELTLDELSSAIGMSGFFKRGKVAMALNELQVAGRVDILPAPAGTLQLQKVKFIKYRLHA